MEQQKKLKILILEDQFLVAQSLISLVESLGHEVCATESSAADAIASARQQRPDLALLDIRVKGMATGIDAGRTIRGELGIPTIFLTEMMEEEAFELAKQTKPHSFLNKPVTLIELKRAIALATLEKGENDASEPAVFTVDDAIFLKGKNGNVRVFLDDVLYLKAGGAYCEVFMKKGKETLAKPLGQILPVLQQLKGGQRFIQIHRSTAVNASHVSKLNGNMLEVEGEQLDVSESFRDSVKAMFPSI